MEKSKWFTIAAVLFFFGAILPAFGTMIGINLDLFGALGMGSDAVSLLLFLAMLIVVWHGGVWKYLRGLFRGKIIP